MYLSMVIALFESKKTSTKNLMYLYFLGQDIHLSDFPEKHPKNADLFFSSENGGGLEYFFFNFFLFILDRPKTSQQQLNLRNLPPLVTP